MTTLLIGLLILVILIVLYRTFRPNLDWNYETGDMIFWYTHFKTKRRIGKIVFYGDDNNNQYNKY